MEQLSETLLSDISQFTRESIDIKETRWWIELNDARYCVTQEIPGSNERGYRIGIQGGKTIHYFKWRIMSYTELWRLIEALGSVRLSFKQTVDQSQLEIDFPD